MFPPQELIRLAERKAALRRTIARRRTQLVAAGISVAQPFAWLDRVLAWWRRAPR